MVKAFKGPNHKYINSTATAIGSATVTISAPYVYLLNGVAQGTGENARIGRIVKNLWLDLDFVAATSAFANSISVRHYVIVETSALGSAIAPAQVFVDPTNIGPTSQRDRTNRNASRYVILWDSKPYSLGGLPSGVASNVVGAGLPSRKDFSIHLPLNFYTDYSRGNAGTVADIDTNSMYLVTVTDNPTSGQLTVSGGFTTCFSDDE